MVAPGTVAMAADLPGPPVYEAPPPVAFGGWYLRGHIGLAAQQFGGLEHPAFDTPDFFEFIDEGNFDAAPIFGIGIGYRLNDWLRFDVTGEYRGKADFDALDRYSFSDPPDFDDGEEWGVNEYTAKKSEWTFLANAYFDMGTWYGVTPYVGGGIGASYNTISDFRDSGINSDTGTVTATGGYAPTGHEWSLAWALHAGASFQVTNNMILDLGYSFTDLGDAQTGAFTANDGSCSVDPCQPVKFKDIFSHDVKLGVRWEFGGAADPYGPAMVKY